MSVVSRPTGPASPDRRPTFLQRISLTQRLVAVVIATAALALLLTGLATFPVLRHNLMASKEQQLLQAMNHADSRAGVGDGSRPGPNPYYVVVGDGQALGEQRLSNITDDVPDPKTLLGADVGPVPITLDDVPSKTGTTHWMVAAKLVQDDLGGWQRLYVAAPLDDVDRTMTTYRLGLLGLGLVVLPIAGLVGAFAVRRAMQPLRDVEQVATAFGNGDTTRRVAGLAPQTEVGRVGTAVNGMLDEIDAELAARQASEERMRRFVGDASHELRTPLAAVRGFAELYRMGAVQKPEDMAGVMRRIEDEAKRMGGLVEDLLLLARMDEQRPMQLGKVDLTQIAADSAQDAHALAPDRTIALRGLGGVPVQPTALIGDEGKIRQVVTNLVANAIRHTPAGSPIELEVGDGGGMAILRVVDHGDGIPAEQQERVFERFFRADSSRSRATGGGSGLGLAIVAAITGAHHGRVRVSTTPGGGATFELAVPQVWQGPRPAAAPSETAAVAQAPA